MNEKVILTKQGYADLETKLEELKFVKRPEIVERIKEARAQGDLSENAEYEAARNEQSLIEGQIAEIEAKLKNATIIEDGARSEDGVVTGSKVTVNYPELNRTDKYVIVGTTESGTRDGEYYRISNESPVGKAILYAKAGDEVEVRAPGGVKKAVIVSID
ncbi:MAG: transcription elongation factor GreA [Clostridia bacterium]|nr:transcription elongation factor GreA [Clostridia bacterium]MBR2968811.1 transcription elongation factor GreA [Clostridia bacterium]